MTSTVGLLETDAFLSEQASVSLAERVYETSARYFARRARKTRKPEDTDHEEADS